MFRLTLPFICVFVSLLFFALSQTTNHRLPTNLSLYETGNRYYAIALQLSTSKKYDEAKADSLNKQALFYFKQVISGAKATQPLQDSLAFWACLKAGELEHTFDSLPEALNYYNQALSIAKTLRRLADTALFKPFILAGVIYYQQSKLDSATAYLKKADSIQDRVPYPLQESGRLYNILGSIYFEYGNYKQAKNYFQKAVEILQQLRRDDIEFFVNYRMNLAASLFKLEDYSTADSIYRSLLPKGKFFLNHINHNLGQVQFLLGKPQEALFYLQKVRYSNQLNVGLHNDFASAYISLGKTDSARKYITTALQENRFYNGQNPNIDYGRTLRINGDIERSSTNLKEALRYYQQALHQFYPSFNEIGVSGNPVKFSGAFSYINLFQTLTAKAEALAALYHQEKKEDWAIVSLETYKAAFALIAYVEQTYESDEARLFLAKIKEAIHDKPIDVAFELYQQTGNKKYLSLLYLFDQQNKATVLALNRQRNAALAENASPLTQRETQLRSEITRLSIRAAQITDSAQLASLNKSIRDYEIELGKVQDKVSSKESLQESKVPSLEYLQSSLLDDKTALVSYHLSPDRLTTLVVTKKAANGYQEAVSRGFSDSLQSEIFSFRMPVSQQAFSPRQALYNLLLNHVSLQTIEQLIIIPDDVLAYLPFESLQNNEGKFLIQQVAVQYQYSTTLLQKSTANFADAATLSFAPFAHQTYSGNLPLLPASAEEVKTANGKQYLDTAATKEKFLQYSPSFPIVHLATHAVVNNSANAFSYVVFSPSASDSENLLYAGEIYNLRLQHTGLVILSACETGAGQLVRGEGVLSLSRAFAYAGCPNIVTSLWKANDFSTAYLTTRLHQYLNKGLNISQALRAAKLDYLSDKTINPRMKQPYYWSHLVFIGNYSPQKKEQWIWYVIGAMIAITTMIVLRKKSRRAGP